MAQALLPLVLLAAIARAGEPAPEQEQLTPSHGTHETVAGEIGLSTGGAGAVGLGGAGLGSDGGGDKKDAGAKFSPPEAPPMSSPVQAALKAAEQAESMLAGSPTKGGCTPPQPKSPCPIVPAQGHWDGRKCIDWKTLDQNARTSGALSWSNDQWKNYFFSLIAKKKLPKAALPASLAAIEPELVAKGAGLQKNSGGEIRGRLFLPNGNLAEPWGRGLDVVQGAGWCDAWGWIPR